MPPQKDQNQSELKQIRTYQGDVAETLEKQGESLVSIHEKEETRRGYGPKPAVSAEDRFKPLLFLLGSLTLIALGVGGAWYGYLEYRRITTPPEIAIPENRFLIVTEEQAVDASTLDRQSLLNVLAKEISGTTAGGTKHLNINLSIADFLETLDSRAPARLIRALDPIFMLGILGGETPSVFLILRLTSYENAFAGMLDWEETLAEDLGPLFATAERLKNLPLETPFRDITSRNKDARAVVLEVPVLIYSFLENDTLIITDNLETLHLLISRLVNERLSR